MKIFETPWIHSTNQLAEVKFFWAEKGDKIGVVSATRGVKFDFFSTKRGGKVQEIQKNAIPDDSKQQRKKLIKWLIEK